MMRARTLSWMASLSLACNEMRLAEGFVSELLAWCAFSTRTFGSDEISFASVSRPC